jgi:hypothetical protein
MCPSPDGRWDVDTDIALQTLIKARKNGLPDYAVELMPPRFAKHLVNVKPEV